MAARIHALVALDEGVDSQSIQAMLPDGSGVEVVGIRVLPANRERDAVAASVKVELATIYRAYQDKVDFLEDRLQSEVGRPFAILFRLDRRLSGGRGFGTSGQQESKRNSSTDEHTKARSTQD